MYLEKEDWIRKYTEIGWILKKFTQQISLLMIFSKYSKKHTNKQNGESVHIGEESNS